MEKVTNPFLVFEGVDGSGKTTIAKRISKEINASYVRTPGQGYEGIRGYIDNGTPPEAKLLYYLSSVFDASSQIKRQLPHTPVVCDRYEWSSLITHSVYFDKDISELEDFWKRISGNIIRPSRTVLFTVNETEQLLRLELGRSLSSPSMSDKFCLDDTKRKGVRRLYEEIAKRENWLIVDTSRRSVDDVACELSERLGLLQHA